jgi:hypothetical protein
VRRRLLLALLPLLACSKGGGADACAGIKETCLSLTLSGAGVRLVDQLELMIMRSRSVRSPMMRMSSAQELPFKVAVLWEDGAATLSVRSYLQGRLNGVTPELTVELSNKAHVSRALTLYPPLPGGGDMGMGGQDLRRQEDLRRPEDLRPPDDLSTMDLSGVDMGDGGG